MGGRRASTKPGGVLHYTRKMHLSIAILLGTFNGERFISQQLDSIIAQTESNWRIYISDDGSLDSTLDIVRSYQAKLGAHKIQFRVNAHTGFARNFLSLACDPMIRADFFAFCDQDDVWLPKKLEVALKIIRRSPIQKPFLYGGRTIYTDEQLNVIGSSFLFIYPPSFRNALIQCVAGGNTMIFNQATKTLLEKVGMVPAASHDWWVYQLVTGAGGVMYYDDEPLVLYRQHPKSVSGGNRSVKNFLIRLYYLVTNRFKEWNDKNIQSLEIAIDYLTHDNAEILKIAKFVVERPIEADSDLWIISTDQERHHCVFY